MALSFYVYLLLLVCISGSYISSVQSTTSPNYNTPQGYFVWNYYPNPAITAFATCGMAPVTTIVVSFGLCYQNVYAVSQASSGTSQVQLVTQVSSTVYKVVTYTFANTNCTGTNSSVTTQLPLNYCIPANSNYTLYGVTRMANGFPSSLVGVFFQSTPPSLVGATLNQIPVINTGITRIYYRSLNECGIRGPITRVWHVPVSVCVPFPYPWMPTQAQQQQYYVIQSCTNNSISVVTHLNSNCQTPFSDATSSFDDMQEDENGCAYAPAGSSYCAATITSTTNCPLSTPYHQTLCTAPSSATFTVPSSAPTSNSNTAPSSNSNTLTMFKQGEPILILSALIFVMFIFLFAVLYFIYMKIERLTAVVKASQEASTGGESNNPMKHRI